MSDQSFSVWFSSGEIFSRELKLLWSAPEQAEDFHQKQAKKNKWKTQGFIRFQAILSFIKREHQGLHSWRHSCWENMSNNTQTKRRRTEPQTVLCDMRGADKRKPTKKTCSLILWNYLISPCLLCLPLVPEAV